MCSLVTLFFYFEFFSSDLDYRKQAMHYSVTSLEPQHLLTPQDAAHNLSPLCAISTCAIITCNTHYENGVVLPIASMQLPLTISLSGGRASMVAAVQHQVFCAGLSGHYVAYISSGNGLTLLYDCTSGSRHPHVIRRSLAEVVNSLNPPPSYAGYRLEQPPAPLTPLSLNRSLCLYSYLSPSRLVSYAATTLHSEPKFSTESLVYLFANNSLGIVAQSEVVCSADAIADFQKYFSDGGISALFLQKLGLSSIALRTGDTSALLPPDIASVTEEWRARSLPASVLPSPVAIQPVRSPDTHEAVLSVASSPSVSNQYYTLLADGSVQCNKCQQKPSNRSIGSLRAHYYSNHGRISPKEKDVRLSIFSRLILASPLSYL